VPVVPILFARAELLWALFVFLLASLTDLLDGYLARRLNQITTFGQLCDPLADKLMLIAVLASLYWVGNIPLWLAIATIVKELTMIVAASLLYHEGGVIPANWLGKAATIAFLPAVLSAFFAAYLAPWHIVLLALATLLAYVAMTQYGILFLKLMRRKRGGDHGA
jgi:cardiolipin synthase